MADQNSITSPSVSSSSSSSSSSNNGNGMAMATVTCIPQQPQSQHTNQHQGCSCPHCYNLWRYQQQQQQQHSYSIPPPPAYTNGAEGEVMYNYDGGYGAPVPPPPGTQAYLRRSASWGPRDSMDFQAQAVPFLPQERRAFVFPVQMGQQQQVPMVDFGVYPTTTASVVPPHPQSNYHYNVAQQQQHGSPVQTRSPQLSRPVSIQDQRTSRKAVSSPANFAHDTSAQSTPPVPVSTNSESNSWSFFTTSSVVVPSPPAQDMDMVTSPPPRVNSSMSPAIPTHQLLSSGYPPAPSYVVQTGPSIVVDQRAVDAQAQLSMEIQALVSAQPPPPPKVNTSFSDFSKLTASLVKSGTPSPPPPSRSPLRSSQGSRSPSGTLSSPNSPQRLAEKKKLKKSSRRKSKKSKSRSQKGSKHRSSSSPKQQQKKRRKKQDQGSDAEESEDDSGALSLELQRTNQNRLIWTKELHTLFLSALDQLGIDAMPKAVLAAMNVEGLTRENIASHLQKYRLKLQQEEKRKSVLQATTGNGQGSSTTTTTTTTSTGSSAPAEQTTQPLSEPTPKVSAPSLAMYRDGGFVDGMDLSLSFPGLLGYCSSDEEEEEEWTNANSSVWFNESQVLSASSSTDSTSNIGDSAVIPSFSFMFLDSEDYDRDQRLRPATPEPPPNSSSSSSSSSSSIPKLSLPVSIQCSCSPCSISSSSDNSPTSTPKVGRPELVVRGSI